MMESISVIIPVYKVEPYLRKCIDSILNQTFKSFDLVLIDDGSPDNCGKICDDYAKQDRRVHVIHQTNAGLSAARNAGIDWAMANSRSKYITFIDSDDYVDPSYLETLFEGISLGVSISCTTFTRVYASGDADRGYKDDNWTVDTPEIYWCKQSGNQIAAVAKLFDKHLLTNIRFPVGKIFEEILTTHKILFSQSKIAFRSYPSYYYLKRSGSITCSSSAEPTLKQIEAFKQQYEYFTSHRFYRAAETARGRICALSIYVARTIKATDYLKCQQLLNKVRSELKNKQLPFWQNRDVYRQITPFKFCCMWPVTMINNFVREGKNSWLLREFIPMLRRIAIERRNRCSGHRHTS